MLDAQPEVHPLLSQRSWVSRSSSSRSSRSKFRQLSLGEKALREMNWDPKPYISTPSSLKGIDLLAGKKPKEEPWSFDASWFVKLLQLQDPAQGSNAQARFWDATARNVYKEESWSSSARKRVEEQRLALHPRPAWDRTPMHHQPWALRGIKPVTREPWDVDMKIREQHDPDKLRRERRRLNVPTPYEKHEPLLLC
jgi:hypothetical protein